MPTSHLYQLNEIVELIVFTDPKSILDVGVGFGKYGFLSREYLELWDGREEYNNWKRRIDGIEVFEGYLTPVHDVIYDHIYIGNALDILATLETNYDLILLIDILEHLDYREGIELLKECKKRGKNIIISTPENIGIQRDTFGNPLETHKFQWKEKHFDKFGNKFFVDNAYSLICYIGDDAPRVRKAIEKSRIRSEIKERFPFLKIPYRIIKRIMQ